MKKLLVLGDSILKGVYMTDDTHHYKLYSDRKFSHLEERGTHVRNVSKMGACISYASATLQKNMDFIDGSTTVLLSFGGNDCDYKWDEVSEDPGGTHVCRTPPDKFIDIYSSCIGAAKARAGRIAVMNLFPIKASMYIDTISKGLSKENIIRWLYDVETLERWHEHYNRLVERLAYRTGCLLVDIRDAFLRDHRAGAYICADGIHPTPEGHRRIHSVIEAALV